MAHSDPPNACNGSQLELLDGKPVPSYAADPDKMRALLHSLLAEARAAQTMPWPPLNAELYRALFPQLTFWLPEDEGARLRFEFETELARLKAA